MAYNKNAPYWMRQALADLVRHEGFREWAYPDPLSFLAKRYKKEQWGFVPASTILAKLGETPQKGGPWTVGIGFTKGVTFQTRMSKEFAMRKLEQEVLEHLWVLDKLAPNWLKMPDVVKTVLANMAFNMGSRLLQFGNTFKLINGGDYAGAGANLKRSAWYRQVGYRATELVDRLITGEIAHKHKID